MAKRRAKASRPRRKPNAGARSGAIELTTAERERLIITRRKAGWTLQAIGEELGITRQSVHEILHRLLDEFRAETDVAADSLRHLELERLDALIAGLWPRAERGNDKAVRTLLRVMHSRALILGLYAGRQLQGKGKLAPSATGELEMTFELTDSTAPAAN